ncbi:hypothetical protein LPJ56_002836 [Coemansia sp. RSA 2599]|nr:hypothetical protein LPJ75_002555 [Coemansia sp. RSA 2598]KAJ1824383.1 hypothetical protein LPJ56_002836 [Coemansia sp. RSA 2599]
MFNIPYLTSCNHCREKKRKCNGKKPTCSLCEAHGVPCEYRRSRRFRKRVQETPPQSLPMATIKPIPADMQRANGAHSGIDHQSGIDQQQQQQQPLTGVSSIMNFAATVPTPGASSVFMPHVSQTASGLGTEVNAFTRLLSGDMYPLTQQLPQPILQGVNNFMSPFSNPRSQTIPEWISQQKPEAAIISNLESLASAYQESPLTPMQSVTTPDGTLFGNLTSQIVYGGNIGSQNQFALSSPYPPATATSHMQQVSMRPPNASSSNCGNGAFSIPGLLAPATTSTAMASQQMALGDIPGMLLPYGTNRRTSSLCSGSHDSELHHVASSGGGSIGRMYAAQSNGRSPSIGAASDTSAPLSNGAAKVANQATRPKAQTQNQIHAQRPRSHPSATSASANASDGRYADDFVPEIIQIYAREFPAELSPDVLLKVMRGIYGSTRTSLVNVDIELSWCMILKGIIPRILLFSYIASMARGQVVPADLVRQLPANFDEICYDVALRDVPLAIASPSLWSALSLYLLGRYEFQSSRYDLMTQHYDMAADMLTKTTFHGYAFPWNDVPQSLKRTFEYDYYVYTFWVCFQWNLVSCFSLDRPFTISLDPSALPQAASSNAYFSADLPCEFDLLTLLPANSWPQSARTRAPGSKQVWFRGFNDPEYSGWRPAEWKKITPNYKITAYLQRMLPLGAHLYRIQREFCEGQRSLGSYLQQLQSQQELLKRWMYSLPKEFEITQEKVLRLTRAAFSPASHGDDANLIMDFKELVMTYGLYNTFLIRANRVALLGMLGENLSSPATTMHTRAFGLRDYIEAADLGLAASGFGTGAGAAEEFSLWERNTMFHRCRMQCYESIDILCNVVQLSFMLRLNLFSYGTTYVAIAGEVLSVLVGHMGIRDKSSMRKTKMRLGHVLCLLRSLQHWAPAVYMFVNGIQALSDPSLVLEVDDAKMQELIRKQKPDEQQRIAGILGADSQQKDPVGGALGSDALQQSSAANPFPPNHIINLIVDDLDSTLTAFLAPAYPMLLLKIFATSNV